MALPSIKWGFEVVCVLVVVGSGGGADGRYCDVS